MHDHLALFGELDGIAHQIDDDLPQTPRIPDQRVRNFRTNFKCEFESLLVRPQAQRLHRVAHAVGQVELNCIDSQFSGLDFRVIEDVVN